MARSQLLIDTVNGKVSMENILLRLKIILSDLENENILKWIQGELNGYSNEDILPEYRLLRGQPKGTYVVNNRVQYREALVPLNFTKLEDDMIEGMLTLQYRDGVPIIEKTLNSGNGNKIGKPVATELCHYISSFELQILSMNIMYSSNDFETILTKVKNKLVDIIMVLEKNFGVIAIDTMDISEQVKDNPEKKQEAATYINQLVYNDTSTSVEIGDKNKIKDSKVGKLFGWNK